MRLRKPFPAQAELVAHVYHFAILEVGFDEFGTGEGLAAFVIELSHAILGFNIEEVWGVAPGIFAVQTEADPAVTAHGHFKESRRAKHAREHTQKEFHEPSLK